MADPVAFALAPGFVQTDSGAAAAGRWAGGDKVRFYRNLPQKIGGWKALTTTAINGMARGARVWTDLLGRQYIAVGTATNLYAISAADFNPVDITPSPFVTGLTDPAYGYGWGVGPWNGGPSWGTPRLTSNLLLEPLFWSLSNFGKILLASPSDQGLYSWDPSQSPVVSAALVPTAPPAMSAFYVTSERFVFALGTNINGARDRMTFHWCGQGDYTDWNVSEFVSTQGGSPAGSRRVLEGTTLVAGTDLGQEISLMWTDTALYTNQYTGSVFVFNTQLAGKACGLAGPLAFVTVGGTAYWASTNSFWMFQGTVQHIPNYEDVSAWVFSQIPQNFAVKTVAFYNSQFSEVWFLFVPTGATEPGVYAVYNTEGQFWFTGTLTRTSATSFEGDLGHPILTGTDGILYQHEEGVDANGVALPFSITSGYIGLSKGSQVSTSGGYIGISTGAQVYEVTGFYNDAERQVGPITVQVSAFEHTMENATPLETEAEIVNPTDGLTDFRVSGRALQVVISGAALGGDWRMGKPAFLGQATGARR